MFPDLSANKIVTDWIEAITYVELLIEQGRMSDGYNTFIGRTSGRTCMTWSEDTSVSKD